MKLHVFRVLVCSTVFLQVQASDELTAANLATLAAHAVAQQTFYEKRASLNGTPASEITSVGYQTPGLTPAIAELPRCGSEFSDFSLEPGTPCTHGKGFPTHCSHNSLPDFSNVKPGDHGYGSPSPRGEGKKSPRKQHGQDTPSSPKRK